MLIRHLLSKNLYENLKLLTLHSFILYVIFLLMKPLYRSFTSYLKDSRGLILYLITF